MSSRDELFLRYLECSFDLYFPGCLATRELNTKITLSWALKQFVTLVYTLFFIYTLTVRSDSCPGNVHKRILQRNPDISRHYELKLYLWYAAVVYLVRLRFLYVYWQAWASKWTFSVLLLKYLKGLIYIYIYIYQTVLHKNEHIHKLHSIMSASFLCA